jgi:hypothetical protein
MEEKKLSEFLKENNAYGSFVEYSVESFLKCLDWYKVFKSENNTISLGNIFIWEDTKEGQNYWRNLKSNLPEPIEYDMDEIIFAEVERRIMKNVFLLGRWAEPQWEVMGIFPDLKTALKHLKEGYWVVEIPFNELYSEEMMEVLSYQIVDGKIWLVDVDGTMLEEVDVEKLTM